VLLNETAGSIAPVTKLNNNDDDIFYVVERLCPSAGAASASACIVPGAATSGGSTSNQTSDNNKTFNTGTRAAFRLTVRVDGKKNTTAYVQTMLLQIPQQ
jgi:hypothetical protein